MLIRLPAIGMLVGLLLGVGISGCSHSSLPVLPAYVPQTSVENVLQRLKLAFLEMNVDLYASLFDEDFRHVPDQRNEGPDMPWQDETWGKEEEIDRIRDLFGGEPNMDGQIVDSCRFDFSFGDTEPSTFHPDGVQVVLDPIEPVIGVTEEATGAEWILQGRLLHPWILHFVQSDDVDPSTGERIWRIARREERYLEGAISWEEFLEGI
jgi:hypothetical protein